MNVWGFEGGLPRRLLRNISALAAASQPTRTPSFDILSPLLLGAVVGPVERGESFGNPVSTRKVIVFPAGPKFENFWVTSPVYRPSPR